MAFSNCSSGNEGKSGNPRNSSTYGSFTKSTGLVAPSGKVAAVGFKIFRFLSLEVLRGFSNR